MKTFLMAAAALGALATGVSAQAATSNFSFQSTAYTFAFTVDTTPTVLVSGPGYFYINNTPGTFNGSAFNFNSFALTAQPNYAAGFSYDGSVSGIFGGAQLFSGATSNPTFLNGVYNLTRQDGATGVLTISNASGAVPEPATWAMMMLGFGGMGYAMRRKNKVAARIKFA